MNIKTNCWRLKKENDRAGRQPVENEMSRRKWNEKGNLSDIKNRPATDGNLLQVPVCTVSHTVAPVYIIIPQISKSVNGVIAISGTCNKVSEVFLFAWNRNSSPNKKNNFLQSPLAGGEKRVRAGTEVAEKVFLKSAKQSWRRLKMRYNIAGQLDEVLKTIFFQLPQGNRNAFLKSSQDRP